MRTKEAIKYLKQLYPNGGHCWLDEQRIEAIGMAIKALQKEPASEDLEKEFASVWDKDLSGKIDSEAALNIARHFADWQKQKDISKVLTEEQCRKIRDDAFELGKDAMKQQMMKEAVDGIAGDFCVYNCDFRRMKKFPFGQKVKIVIFKGE